MLEAYKNLEIEVDLDGLQLPVEIPFTVGLLERVEEYMAKAYKKPWWNSRERNMVKVFREFCEPYLPDCFDHEQAQPVFYALFFSSVKKAVESSLDQCMNDMVSTVESEEPTEEKTTEESESAA